LHFNFGLLITSLKPLDRNHWNWRYIHSGSGHPSVKDAAASGASVINIHQGDASAVKNLRVYGAVVR
jgi:Family of unknown function (DUF6067)